MIKNRKRLFKIGYHSGIDVTSGFVTEDYKKPAGFTGQNVRELINFLKSEENASESSGKHEVITEKRQTIDQVFAAAYDISAFRQGTSEYDTAAKIAQKILEWTYEAILRAAIVKNKKMVVLPRIGGGVFKNEQAWIDDAILSKTNVELIKKHGLHVTVNNFYLDPKSYPRDPRVYSVEETRNRFKDAQKEVGGGAYVFVDEYQN